LGNQCNFRTPNPCRIYRLQGSIWAYGLWKMWCSFHSYCCYQWVPVWLSAAEALIDDLKDTRGTLSCTGCIILMLIRIVRSILYNNSTTSLFFRKFAKNQIFVPNERQHFKIRQLKKTA
jgi:hypothetical protein